MGTNEIRFCFRIHAVDNIFGIQDAYLSNYKKTSIVVTVNPSSRKGYQDKYLGDKCIQICHLGK